LERLAPLAGDPMFLGVHLEGPFLGAAPGAHPVEHIRPVDVEWLAQLLDRFPGIVRIVTLAPEADRQHVATRLLVKRGVTVALAGGPVATAVAMATATPARVLGVTARGRLVRGARADVVALDPHTLVLTSTLHVPL